MRKDFRLNFSVFIFSTICLESGNAGFVFSEEIIRRPENSFDDTLFLLQKLMADSSVFLNARSQLLEVIFLFGADGSSVQLGYHQQHIYGRRGQMGQQYLYLLMWKTLKSECYIGILIFSSSCTKRY
jgi:hypothetical protein